MRKTPEQKIREKQHRGLTQDERIARLNLSWAREFWLLRRREKVRVVLQGAIVALLVYMVIR